jgi:leucine-rich repeat protein SHOC2
MRRRWQSHFHDENILDLWREGCPALQSLWPANTAESTWEGVTFADHEFGKGYGQQVVGIKLNGKLGDAIEVPAELGSLLSLTRLDLRGNRLTSLPASLKYLNKLERLYVENNQLTSVPAELGELRSLRELFLNGNQLTGLPVEIGSLSSLTLLGLSRNQLTSIPAHIGQLTALTMLDVSDNQLTGMPAALGALISLEKLYKQNNQLRSIPAEFEEFLERSGSMPGSPMRHGHADMPTTKMGTKRKSNAAD